MYSSIETIALILAILTLVRLLFVITNRKFMINLLKPVYKNYQSFSIILVIISGIILYFLMQTLSIVQIFAVTLFVATLFGAALMTYGTDYLKIAEKLIAKKHLPWTLWIQIIIWTALSLWVLYLIIF